jgi:drug/metabolite transporter (DMT)-like permease
MTHEESTLLTRPTESATVTEVTPTTSPGEGHAALMLVFVTVLWGLSFPLVKSWQEAARGCPGGEVVASATLIAVRMLLALPMSLMLQPRLLAELVTLRPNRFGQATLAEHGVGAILGVIFFAGFIAQIIGLAWTTPALSGFFTSLGCAWVPPMMWLCWRTRVPPITMLGIVLGLVGVAVLSELDAGVDSVMGRGEALTLFASVLFAVQIIVLDVLGKRVRPGTITVAFFATTGICGLVVALVEAMRTGTLYDWAAWSVRTLGDPAVLRDVLLMTVLSTVIAFHGMNRYQPRVSASRAALIYLLEPVFAAFFSVISGYDTLTGRLLLGGGIILGGNLLVELPGLLRERNRTS